MPTSPHQKYSPNRAGVGIGPYEHPYNALRRLPQAVSFLFFALLNPLRINCPVSVFSAYYSIYFI